MARVIAIANQKGGVGKTTTAVNLSAAIATAERRVLLIDFDPQSNATSALGHNPAELKREIYHALIGQNTLEEVIVPTEISFLQLAPTTPELIGYEVESREFEKPEYQLKDVMESVRSKYDYIFIDCPPSLGQLTVNALTAADAYLVPLQAEYFALEGLSHLLQTTDLIRDQLNPDLDLEGIVLTMFDQRNRLAHQVASEVQAHFPKHCFESRIRRNVRLSEAPSFGKPILLYDIRSVGAENYLALAKELLERNQALNKQAHSEQRVEQNIERSENQNAREKTREESIGEGPELSYSNPRSTQDRI